MTESDILNLLARLRAQTLTATDQEVLADLYAKNRLIFTNPSMAIGGNVTDSILVSGNNNIIIQAPDADALRDLLRVLVLQPAQLADQESLDSYLHALGRYATCSTYITLPTPTTPETFVPLSFRPVAVSRRPRGLVHPAQSLDLPALFSGNGPDSPFGRLIVGAPGSGKSMLLRQLARYGWSDPTQIGLTMACLPLPVRLRWLATAEGSTVEERLRNALAATGELILTQPLPAGFLTQWAQCWGTRWLLLLDGLDEVPVSARSKLLKWLQNALPAVANQISYVVVTSRPGENLTEDLGSQFAGYEIEPLDEAARAVLAKSWVGANTYFFLQALDRITDPAIGPLGFGDALEPEEDAEEARLDQGRVVQAVRRSDPHRQRTSHPPFPVSPRPSGSRRPPHAVPRGTHLTLVGTPLLLAMAGRVYRHDDTLPEYRSALYDRFVTLWLNEADELGMAYDLMDKDLHDLVRHALEYLALRMSQNGNLTTDAALHSELALFLQTQLRLTKALAQVRAGRLLEVLGRRSGVLVRHGTLYEWSHPTFREYLAASALRQALDESGQDYDAPLEKIHLTPQWDQVWAQLRETLGDPTDLRIWLAHRCAQLLQDPALLPAQRRRCLRVLGTIGHRDSAVTSALEVCLQHTDPDRIATIRLVLWVAHRLRYPLVSQAVDLLRTPDWVIVDRAAAILTEFPTLDALPVFKQVLDSWESTKHTSIWTYSLIRDLIVALARIHDPTVTPTIMTLLQSALKGQRKLNRVETIWIVDHVGFLEARRLLVEDLGTVLHAASPIDGLWQQFDRLQETWQPDDLAVLVHTSEDLRHSGIDLATYLIDGIIHGSPVDKEGLFRQHRVQEHIVHLLGKSQAISTVPELARLLPTVHRFVKRDIEEALWVIGDLRGEGALLAELEQSEASSPEEDTSRLHDRVLTVRALGTCVSRSSALRLLGYLHDEPQMYSSSPAPDIIPHEGIIPLVRRGVLTPTELEAVARDRSAASPGRAVALLSLAILKTSGWVDLCLDLLDATEQDVSLQGFAAGSLGRSGDPRVIPTLRRVLQTTQHASIAGYATAALAQLRDLTAIEDIEAALLRYRGTVWQGEFISALARLDSPNALSLVHQCLSDRDIEADSHWTSILAKLWPDPEIVALFERQIIQPDTAAAIVHAMRSIDPEWLLDMALAGYTQGGWEDSPRRALALALPQLARLVNSRWIDLIRLLTWLVCDPNLYVREYASLNLTRIPRVLRRAVYVELRTRQDAWSRACRVYSLGFWDSKEPVIRDARHDPELVVRHFADIALPLRQGRRYLRQLMDQYCASDGLARYAAYVCLSEHADEWTIRRLRRQLQEEDVGYIFLRSLEAAIHKQVEDARKKRAEAEEKFFKDREYDRPLLRTVVALSSA